MVAAPEVFPACAACVILTVMPGVRLKGFLSSLLGLIMSLMSDGFVFLTLVLRPRTTQAAEILFLRKQLALYREHQVPPARLTNAARLRLVFWSRLCDWKEALMIVKPETLIRWHREGFRLFWRWKSRPGRPRLPRNIRELIVRMVEENPTWGQARVADELSLKLGIQVSPRTVRAYWPSEPEGPGPRRASSQHWKTFIRNHAQTIIACDFLVAVTARFRLVYVFILMEIGTRRILHFNVTSHPTAVWTLQQFREAIPSDHSYRFLIHDRDSIFSAESDEELKAFGLKVLRTPVRAPQANAYCERLIGTLRRECLDFLIPLGEKHLRRIVREWVIHYNQGRPHSSLGPGIPEADKTSSMQTNRSRHQLPQDARVTAKEILGGLHHEYRLERLAA